MRIAHRLAGSGPRCYAHPGGPGFSSRYLTDLGGLESIFTICYVDPRGTGTSEWPARSDAYSLDDYVEDLAGLIKEEDEPCILLGHSHGGFVAQRFAARYPDRLRGLILADTAPRFADEIQADMERRIEARRGQPWFADAYEAMQREQAAEFQDGAELGALVARELPFYFYHYGEREKAYADWIAVEACNPDALRQFNQTEFLTLDLRPELERITAKTVILTGEDDFICPPSAAHEMHEGIANSRLVIIPKAGHFTFVEQPEAFRAAAAAVI